MNKSGISQVLPNKQIFKKSVMKDKKSFAQKFSITDRQGWIKKFPFSGRVYTGRL